MTRNFLQPGILGVLACIFVLSANAASVIPFQGQLTDQAGAPLNPASAVNLVFRIYQGPSGGTAAWEETQPSVVVIGGRFNVLLGSRTPFDTATLTAFNNTVYLGITVDDGNAATTDVELRPRQAIVPVIFAENARNADKLDGFDWSSLLINKNTLAPSGDVASPDVIVPGNKVGKVAEAANAENAILFNGMTLGNLLVDPLQVTNPIVKLSQQAISAPLPRIKYAVIPDYILPYGTNGVTLPGSTLSLELSPGSVARARFTGSYQNVAGSGDLVGSVQVHLQLSGARSPVTHSLNYHPNSGAPVVMGSLAVEDFVGPFPEAQTVTAHVLVYASNNRGVNTRFDATTIQLEEFLSSQLP